MAYKGLDKELGKLVRQVYDAIGKKAMFLDRIKNHPAVVGSSGMSPDYATGFKQALERYSTDDVWSLDVYTSLGSVTYMVANPDDLRVFLERELHLIFNPEKVQSPKVLAKMVAIRLTKAYNTHLASLQSAKDAHQRNAVYLENTRKALAYLKSFPPNQSCQVDMGILCGLVDMRQFSAKDMVDNIAQRSIMVERYEDVANNVPDLSRFDLDLKTATQKDILKWTIRHLERNDRPPKEFSELRNFISRSDITNEMCRMACDLTLMREVMEQ